MNRRTSQRNLGEHSQSLHREVGWKKLQIKGILLPQTDKREKSRNKNKPGRFVPVKTRPIVRDSSGDILAEIDTSGST